MKDLANDPCRFCQEPGPHIVKLRTSGVHYADCTCAKCGKHLGFPPKPDSDPSKYRRPTAHRDLVADYSRGFCEMCLRKHAELPKGQTLEAQHVVEFQDGGGNERGNIWIICTACHRMIHWIRTYHGTYKVSHVLALVEAELPST